MTAEKKNRFTLKLDEVERQAVADPFDVEIEGKTFKFADAMEVDWQDLVNSMTSGNIRQFFNLVLGDQAAEFFKVKIPTWKMRYMMEQYQAHHGLGDAGESLGSAA